MEELNVFYLHLSIRNTGSYIVFDLVAILVLLSGLVLCISATTLHASAPRSLAWSAWLSLLKMSTVWKSPTKILTAIIRMKQLYFQ